MLLVLDSTYGRKSIHRLSSLLQFNIALLEKESVWHPVLANHLRLAHMRVKRTMSYASCSRSGMAQGLLRTSLQTQEEVDLEST